MWPALQNTELNSEKLTLRGQREEAPVGDCGVAEWKGSQKNVMSVPTLPLIKLQVCRYLMAPASDP